MARTDKEKNKAYNREYMRKKREAAKAAGVVLASDEWRKLNPNKARAIELRYAERHPDKIKEKSKRQRLRRQELGIKLVRSPEQKEANKEAMRIRRQAAKDAGARLPSDEWRFLNPDKHRENGRRWSSGKSEAARSLFRRKQAIRRSTPWGMINNRIWSVMHSAVRRNSSRSSKYTQAMGFLWSDLRAHLELQFVGEMSWETWGSVWELDHIKPLKLFQYTSLDDPLFREAWSLSNLRPLPCIDNSLKGGKH